MSRKNRPKNVIRPGNKKMNPPKKKSDLRSEYEQCYVVAKKILLHFGFEPELIDVFSKKQRQMLLNVCYEKPVIKAKKERTVPRPYIRNINSDTYEYMRTNYWGDPEHKITYMELATFGFSFLGNLSDFIEKKSFLPDSPQEEAARRIFEKLQSEALPGTAFGEVLCNVWYMTRAYSRVNYRMYGFEFEYERKVKPCGCCYTNRLRFLLTALDSESKMFTYNHIDRKAYRMFKTAEGFYEPKPATVSSKKIYPKAMDDVELNIYIQSHVLHRFKERMDALEPLNQNLVIHYTFTHGLELVSFDNQTLFACLVEDGIAGYFTFFLKGGDIVINTFLPLTSQSTPEGKKLYESLLLSKEEIKYLGMDKISFLVKVDFEQIPKLKQALIESNFWPIKLVLDRICKDDETDTLIDRNKTIFVKNYFDKLEEYQR